MFGYPRRPGPIQPPPEGGRISQASQWCPPPASPCLPCVSFCLAPPLLRLSDLRFFFLPAAGCHSSLSLHKPTSSALPKASDGERRGEGGARGVRGRFRLTAGYVFQIETWTASLSVRRRSPSPGQFLPALSLDARKGHLAAACTS